MISSLIEDALALAALLRFQSRNCCCNPVLLFERGRLPRLPIERLDLLLGVASSFSAAAAMSSAHFSSCSRARLKWSLLCSSSRSTRPWHAASAPAFKRAARRPEIAVSPTARP